MKKFDQKAFDQFIIDQEIVGFFGQPIKLVSGRTTYWYVNWRTALYDAVFLDKVSDFLLAFLQDHNLPVDCFYGIPDGTTKLAVISQYKLLQQKKNISPGEYVYAMGRKTPKEHGEPKDRFFVGQPRGNVIVLEDVTTTGQSVYKHVQIIRDFGVNVVAVVTLTNRNEVRDDGKPISSLLEDINVPYFALSNALQLLPLIVKQRKPSKAIKDSIIEEFRTYGEKEIKL